MKLLVLVSSWVIGYWVIEMVYPFERACCFVNAEHPSPHPLPPYLPPQALSLLHSAASETLVSPVTLLQGGGSWPYSAPSPAPACVCVMEM